MRNSESHFFLGHPVCTRCWKRFRMTHSCPVHCLLMLSRHIQEDVVDQECKLSTNCLLFCCCSCKAAWAGLLIKIWLNNNFPVAFLLLLPLILQNDAFLISRFPGKGRLSCCLVCTKDCIQYKTDEIAPGMYESLSDVGEIRVYFASKILTPCRMH